MKLYYSPAYVAASHAFETTRKSRWIAESLDRDPIPGIEVVAPTAITECETLIRELHDPHYVDAVRTGEPRALATSQGFRWDPAFYDMVVASTTGVLEAARTAKAEGVSGSLSSGLHHARRDRGAGACTFNGLALAARTIASEHGCRVLILDFDAHCGGGTHSLVADHASIFHVDVATVSVWDEYVPDGLRSELHIVRSGGEYLAKIDEMLGLLHGLPFGLCLYNAGMDPYELCSDGALEGITREVLAEREHKVFAWCRAQNLPVAFVMAGGYLDRARGFDVPHLVGLHRLTLQAAVGLRPT